MPRCLRSPFSWVRLVGLTGHNKILVPAVNAPAVRLSLRHGKVRRDGYRLSQADVIARRTKAS